MASSPTALIAAAIERADAPSPAEVPGRASASPAATVPAPTSSAPGHPATASGPTAAPPGASPGPSDE